MNPVRIGFALVVIGAVVIAGTTGAFVFFFHTHAISTDVSDWGAFGSYLGGVWGASISILALVGAVIAIYQQHKTDEKTKKHIIASDLMRTIERLERDIDAPLSNYPVKVHYSDAKMELDSSALKILTELHLSDVATHLIPEYSTDIEEVVRRISEEDLSEQERLEKMRIFDLFGMTCAKLAFMRSLLTQHKSLSGHNAVALYYKSKYKVAAERLRQENYPLESWGEIDRMDS